jgi:hypothetical protein
VKKKIILWNLFGIINLNLRLISFSFVSHAIIQFPCLVKYCIFLESEKKRSVWFAFIYGRRRKKFHKNILMNFNFSSPLRLKLSFSFIIFWWMSSSSYNLTTIKISFSSSQSFTWWEFLIWFWKLISSVEWHYMRERTNPQKIYIKL